VLVVTRYVVPTTESPAFLERATAALAALAARPGWRSGRLGRATDDASAWVLTTEWDSVGAYRRALSAYDVKVVAVPLLSLATDEVSAFEVLVATGLGSDGLAGPSGLA
jgi:heme oxygenase (mycobilin-producing)